MIKLGHIAGHTFLQNTLDATSVIIDLGVNHGQFSKGCLARFKAHVFGVEPDPRAYKDAKLALGENVINAAINDSEKPVLFYVCDYDQCSSIYRPEREVVDEIQVQGITLGSLLERIKVERVSLLKVDIEGGEYPLLLITLAVLLQRCDQISVEFHNAPEWPIQENFEKCCARLKTLGFERMDFSDGTWMHDVLFLNRETWKLNFLERWVLIPLQAWASALGRKRREK